MDKVWPYTGVTSGGTEENQAENVCKALYLDLAVIKTEEESFAIQEMSSTNSKLEK